MSTTIQRIGWALAELTEKELLVAEFIIWRLHNGHMTYGDVDFDKRDWRVDMLEEMADLMNYTAFQALKENRGATP